MRQVPVPATGDGGLVFAREVRGVKESRTIDAKPRRDFIREKALSVANPDV